MYYAINLNIVPVILVCSTFLISVCMFILSKALLILSATVIVSAGGAIWCCLMCVVPSCCVLYPGCVGVFGMFAVM